MIASTHIPLSPQNIFFFGVKSSQTLFRQQGYTLRKIEGSHVLWDCEIQGAQHCFLGKNWDFLVTRGYRELLELSFGQGSHICHWLVSKRALCKLGLQSQWLLWWNLHKRAPCNDGHFFWRTDHTPYVKQVKIKFRLNFFNLGWCSIFFVFKP